MKPENQAWESLRQHAGAQLRGGFADRVLRAARGPSPAAWRQLQAGAAAELRPGFAERVLRAARAATEMPSFGSQLALSAATAAVCLGAVLFVQHRRQELADAHNLAEWRNIVTFAQEIDPSGP
jgi:hypothetical protein